jgi:hypothetical protein
MSIDYNNFLTIDQKKEILNARILQFAREAYQYSLNLKAAESIGSENQIESIKKSLEVLEAAIKIHQDELNELPPSSE